MMPRNLRTRNYELTVQGEPMSFISFLLRDLWSKRARSIALMLAVAFAIMIIVTLQVTSNGLEQSAASVISIGKADITVAQKNVSDVLSSSIDQGELARIRAVPGVRRAIGVLVETEHLNAKTPLFIEIGIAPQDQAPFGVHVVAGHPYAPTASNQMMLGWRAAANFGLRVGSYFPANGTWNRVTGIYSTGNSYGDSGAMFPLPALQAYNRLPSTVTLAFVQDAPGASAAAVASRIAYRLPELTTIRTASQFGQADRNLIYLKAAVTASTILAVLVGAVIVGNAMYLSVIEETRELGLLRAIGWTRRRMVNFLFGEGFILTLAGATLGVALSFAVTAILQALPDLAGVLHADYTAAAFGTALLTAVAMTVLGGLYPTARAARLEPLKALSYE